MTHNDNVEQLDRVRRRLNYLHETKDISWRTIAQREEYSGVSHSTLRDIANGENPSIETCRKLGVRKTNRWRLHYEAGRGEKGRERYERVKAFLESRKYENLTELVDELMEVAADDIKGKE